MSDLKQLTRLQRLVIAALEEAGEENVACLINTLRKQQSGSPEEVETMIAAIAGLIRVDLVRIAVFRDPVALHLVDLSKEESLAAISGVGRLLEWSNRERIWSWRNQQTLFEVVTTKAGKGAAEQILSEDGWPSELN